MTIQELLFIIGQKEAQSYDLNAQLQKALAENERLKTLLTKLKNLEGQDAEGVSVDQTGDVPESKADIPVAE